MRAKIFSLFLFLLFLGSCSVPKDVAYFQGIDDLTDAQIEGMSQTYISEICPDDLLTITVTAWDPTVVTPFNPPPYSYAVQGGASTSSSTSQLHTYLVDQEGYINFPVIGRIKAAGYSKQAFSEMLQEKITKYVQEPIVNVQIVNYKIIMMGEISRPGKITVQNDRITILDAIGQSGDLTINANRRNILIIRDSNGQKERGRIDLTDPALFASPYYYLRQNDVVYVEPNDAKKRNARYSQAQQYNLTIFSTILSTVSVISSIIIATTR
ncbi:MAG: polysaccharide biosynthesis/export family protein [Massilibacteroides sp.]|nr:polysaccharide biosynthesis/export family protein [Massilibacteroides sp.]MDD3062604.1 polysaccharide biosynthesis/export family protein [Massilibacteroides sp.]MDD4115583.1 polysaccharide biosynthesis/export family protein [Massilibacteroides sp.]